MPRKYIVLLALVLPVVLLDQWSKLVVLRELTTAFPPEAPLGTELSIMMGEAPPLGFDGLHYRQKRAITVLERYFRLRYAENPGAAFGLFRALPPHVRGPLFHAVSLGAVLLIGYYFRQLTGKDPKERWALWGLPLVLAGALGNYLDRLARGFVIDFLEFHWRDQAAWPSFNVADVSICVGVGMLVLDALVRREPKVAVAG